MCQLAGVRHAREYLVERAGHWGCHKAHSTLLTYLLNAFCNLFLTYVPASLLNSVLTLLPVCIIFSCRDAFASQQVLGMQEEVQLREQDFGNFQDAAGKEREKAERLRFGRFFYRFPNGESGADVYDRITVFQDHLIRDINAGRFANNTSLVLVTHGLALRIFLMRWFHWSVDQFMHVYNPANAVPIILERVEPGPGDSPFCWHTKSMYKLNAESLAALKGCTSDMCTPVVSYIPGEVLLNPGEGFGSQGGGYGGFDETAQVESAWEQWAELGGGW
eukprot:GHUV01018523.1.p2 GENE.GHUV01018523.1~~GHUV01018523.1.p2  ORF type:complete len:276 (+),score=47.89 GHUV01018523.1:2450-3277(+)